MKISKFLSVFKPKNLPMLKPDMVNYAIRPYEVVDISTSRFINSTTMKDGFYKKTIDTNATENYIRTVLNNRLP